MEVVVRDDARHAVQSSCDLLRSLLDGDAAMYGVNTGFGRLASKRIDAHALTDLQRNLVLSHSVGVGDPLPDRVVALAMALKIASLAKGASGVRPVLVDTISTMLARGVIPAVPGQGSVGASGDLAPLAHIAAVVIGCGRASVRGAAVPGAGDGRSRNRAASARGERRSRPA